MKSDSKKKSVTIKIEENKASKKKNLNSKVNKEKKVENHVDSEIDFKNKLIEVGLEDYLVISTNLLNSQIGQTKREYKFFKE